MIVLCCERNSRRRNPKGRKKHFTLESVFPTRVELCILFFLLLLSCNQERRDFVFQCLADTKESWGRSQKKQQKTF